MQKVVFIINSLAGGGAERIMARIVTYSPREGNEIHLVLLDEDPEAYGVPDWVNVHRLDTRGSLWKGYFSLRKLLRHLRPDFVLSFLTRSNLLAIIICGALGTRCVISERVNTTSHHPNNFNGWVSRLLTRLFYPRANAVIAVSDGIAQDLQQNYAVDPAKIIVIPNPIDTEEVLSRGAEPHGLKVNRPLVVAMGRLVPNKNFAMLIEAYKNWQGSGTLVLLGDGPLRPELEAQIKNAGIDGRVIMPGFQENPFAIIAAADCYVLPSNGEGFPNGLIEAMILGTPVISTNCHSGPAEILDDRPYFEVSGPTECKYGLLVPTNDPQAMAEAMATVLRKGQRPARSERARLGAARYNLESTIRLYWSTILGSSTGRL